MVPDSFALVDEATEALSVAVRELEPENLEPDDAARLVKAFTALTKLAESGRTIVAPYMEGSGLWRREGHRSPEAWLAADAGISYGEAKAILETGRRLVQAPEVDDAARDGDLSFDQMKEVAVGAEADPDAAGRLLDAAGRDKTLKQLRDETRRVKAAAEDDQYGVYERQRRARRVSHGSKPDGMAWLYAEFTPEVGAAVVSHLEAETDRVFREAHREGREEPRAAFMADALTRLITEGHSTKGARGRAKGVRAEVIVMVDRDALLRGRVEPGETCEILGQGPIPVEVCHQIMGDAFLRGVLVDGTEVTRVESFGRHITTEQRVALTVEAFLEHGDLVCSVDGCDRPDIDWDHLHEYAHRGATATWNLNPLCRGHHRDKTAGLLELVDGRWRSVEPVRVGRAPP